MGTKMGPSYANLFVGFIENTFFSNYHGPKPDLYKRYIDDCVGATLSTRSIKPNLCFNLHNNRTKIKQSPLSRVELFIQTHLQLRAGWQDRAHITHNKHLSYDKKFKYFTDTNYE